MSATGTHTPASKSITVAEAAERLDQACVELERRERARSHGAVSPARALHINRAHRQQRLASLTTPRINTFRDDLLASMSRPWRRKVLTSLKSLLKDAQRRGNVAQNVARAVAIGADKRGKRKLKVGVDIPTTDEIKAMIDAACRPLAPAAADRDLHRPARVRAARPALGGRRPQARRAARAPARRPLQRHRQAEVRSWRAHDPARPARAQHVAGVEARLPEGRPGLVFPTASGRIEHHTNIVRALGRRCRALGCRTQEGKPKYTGLHALRHFYASWCINRLDRGGQGLPPKVVQERLGHSSIVMTMDPYGHLFPRGMTPTDGWRRRSARC